jgi:hypothetical protein
MSVAADGPVVAEKRVPPREAATQQVVAEAGATEIDFATWFGRAMWLGILADWALGIPGIFWPNATLGLAGQAPDLEHPVWPAFASLLLVLLSLFYIPGALDLRRYKATAILSVLARPPGVIFFLWLWPGLYPAFGYLDLVLTLIQAPLLFLALRQQSQTEI